MTSPRKPSKGIPVSDLKVLAKLHGQSHAVLMTYGPNGVTHIVTWGGTPDQCAQAAVGGNKMKKALGWPESLQTDPAVVTRARKRIAELEETVSIMKKMLTPLPSRGDGVLRFGSESLGTASGSVVNNQI